MATFFDPSSPKAVWEQRGSVFTGTVHVSSNQAPFSPRSTIQVSFTVHISAFHPTLFDIPTLGREILMWAFTANFQRAVTEKAGLQKTILCQSDLIVLLPSCCGKGKRMSVPNFNLFRHLYHALVDVSSGSVKYWGYHLPHFAGFTGLTLPDETRRLFIQRLGL